jgi:hypothetical protein
MSTQTPDRAQKLLLIAGVLIALAYAAYTRSAWEDYWITYRSSKNLALGNGLVFQPGERLHGFTSPVGVLLPALLSRLVGNNDDFLVLWLFRLASAALFAASGIAIIRAHRSHQVVPAVTLFTLLLAATETKIVAFSVNGQESAFLVFFLCLSWASLARGARFALVPLAVAWAGLQWTRPDGFVYGGCIALGTLAFAVEGGWLGRLRALGRMTKAALLALVLYSPWLLWCWSFYGTPVPHTVIAKTAYAPPHDLRSLVGGLAAFPLELFEPGTSVRLAFAPIYAEVGQWPPIVMGASLVLGALAALYWVLPFGGRAARALSLAFALGHFYQSKVIAAYPWYLPATTILGVLTIGLIGNDLVRLAAALAAHGFERAAGQVRRLTLVTGATTAGFVMLVLLASAYHFRIYQREIEDRGRMQIGLWLRSQLRPSETIFLEPLGYISFFSGGKMLDFPGLVSREVVSARRELGTNDWRPLIARLKPDWLVLRPIEARQALPQGSPVADLYELVRVFDATPRLAQYSWVPARRGFDYDRVFLVFRRRAD